MEHGDEIAKHEAAKRAFDGLGGQSIPKVAQLSQQYAELLSEKQSYTALRQSMIAYRTAKQNADKILGIEAEREQKSKTEKER